MLRPALRKSSVRALPSRNGRENVDKCTERGRHYFLLKETKKGSLGKSPRTYKASKILGFRYAETGVCQVEETAAAAVTGGGMVKRALLGFHGG